MENITESKIICDDERRMIALEASWEIEQLTMLTMKLAEDFDDIETLQFRGIGARIKELNNALMSALGEPAMTNDKLFRMVHGRLMPKMGREV